MNELSSLGLQPDVLHELMETSEDTSPPTTPPDAELEQDHQPNADRASTHSHHFAGPKVVYELSNVSGRIEPRLRIWTKAATPSLLTQSLNDSAHSQSSSEDHDEGEGGEHGVGEAAEHIVSPAVGGHTSLLWDFQRLYFGGHAAGGRGDIREEANAKGIEGLE